MKKKELTPQQAEQRKAAMKVLEQDMRLENEDKKNAAELAPNGHEAFDEVLKKAAQPKIQ